MRGKDTFFTLFQKQEHAQEVGWQCEAEIEKGIRCPTTIVEGDHVQPVSKGGKTVVDNLEFLCKPHHAIRHLIEDQPWSANLILARMTDEEKAIYTQLKP